MVAAIFAIARTVLALKWEQPHGFSGRLIAVPAGSGIGVELLLNVPWERRELFTADRVLSGG
jgi:hypothetical protein